MMPIPPQLPIQLNAPRRSNRLWPFLALIMLLGILPLAQFALFAFSPHKVPSEKPVVIQIRKGQTPGDVTRTLLSNDLISNGKWFIWLGRGYRQWTKIKVGEYQLSASMTPYEILSTLTSGISISYPLTVREGENMYEIAHDLQSKSLGSSETFLNLCRNLQFIASLKYFSPPLPVTLEGYIAPDTYLFNKTMSEADIIKQMVRHFFDHWGPSEIERSKALKLNLHQVVTLASIIEKETGAAEERPLISSVFHNRLQKGMRLQSDPTTIYGMWDHYEGKIHKKDLTAKNAYNTYAIDGLPLGPISNPGKEAIHAALFPAESSFFYFVSHNDGTHQFSRSIDEHNQAVRKFQMDPKARIGKSWRNRLRQPSNRN